MGVNNLISSMLPQITSLAVVYMLCFVAIILDLISGIRKARKRGKTRSSYALRKTVDKVIRYYSMLLVITAIDIVQMTAVMQWDAATGHGIPAMPLLTFVGAIFVGFIELKSIYENSEEKEQARIEEAAGDLSELLKKIAKAAKEIEQYNGKRDEVL